MHHCENSLNINTQRCKTTVQNDCENSMFPFHRGTGLLEPLSLSFAVLIHGLFSTWNVPWATCPPSSLSSSSSSSGEKWPAVWLPVLFLKGDVIYPQYQTLQSAGAECSTDTSIWQSGEGGREGVKEDGARKMKNMKWDKSWGGKAEALMMPLTDKGFDPHYSNECNLYEFTPGACG